MLEPAMKLEATHAGAGWNLSVRSADIVGMTIVAPNSKQRTTVLAK